MPIEMRVDTTGVVSVVIACNHCGRAIEDVVDGGVTVWLPGDCSAPETSFVVDYAHEDCEDRFLSGGSYPPQVVEATKKLNIPLGEFLEMMSETLDPRNTQ